MVLDHVAEGSGFFVVAGAAFHAERFAGCDLDMVDVARVPHRFKEGICEAEDDDVLRSLFVRVDKFIEGETAMMKNKDDQSRRFGGAPRAAVADQGYRQAPKPVTESEDVQ